MKWDALKKLDAAVDGLVKKAQMIAPSVQTLRRPITALFDVSMLATAFTYTELSATYVHNSTDKLYLTRLYCVVRKLAAGVETDQTDLFSGPWGWFWAAVGQRDAFDFVWNMRQQSAQRTYANIPLASQCFGGNEIGAGIEFVQPWVIPPNDAMTFMATPTSFALDGTTTDTFRIHFIGCGYRGE